MNEHVSRTSALVFGGSLLFLGASIAGGSASPAKPTAKLQDPGIGGIISGASVAETAAFESGKEAFSDEEGPEKGLGPVFNGVSCGECHIKGAVGGAGFDLVQSRVTRIGAMRGFQYSDLTEVGGPVLQRRSLKEFFPRFPVGGEVVPREAQFVSRRITTPLFGAGLIESIPDSTIVQLSQRRNPDGIKGTINNVLNPETKRIEIGRFGWKSQVSTLRVFSGDAYLNEMGITTPLFNKDNFPQGKDSPGTRDQVADPEDDGGDMTLFADYMRLLAPPERTPMDIQRTRRGEQIFNQINCSVCHVPALQTSPTAKGVLANKRAELYSDLLLHKMGRGLDDGVRQGQALGEDWRTAPLWGLRYRQFFMHDGRAQSIESAVLAHDGEAATARTRFQRLGGQDKNAILEFLRSL